MCGLAGFFQRSIQLGALQGFQVVEIEGLGGCRTQDKGQTARRMPSALS